MKSVPRGGTDLIARNTPGQFESAALVSWVLFEFKRRSGGIALEGVAEPVYGSTIPFLIFRCQAS
jgi:hypothetical protein